jgi:hypothetical protein
MKDELTIQARKMRKSGKLTLVLSSISVMSVNTTQLASCWMANSRHIFRRLLQCTAYHIRTRYSNNNQNEKETYSIDVTNSTEQEAVKLISCCINN